MSVDVVAALLLGRGSESPGVNYDHLVVLVDVGRLMAK